VTVVRRTPNIVLGAVLGLAMALGFTVIALVIYRLRGPETFERLGTSLSQTIALYVIGGIIGGGLFGLLLPLTTYRWGASLVGVCAAVPFYLAAAVVADGTLSSGLIPAVVVGAIAGYVLWTPTAGAADAEEEGSG
jgi:NhaP-type Na+/H+ or K+/H+ antiporter